MHTKSSTPTLYNTAIKLYSIIISRASQDSHKPYNATVRDLEYGTLLVYSMETE